jgi:hypothetical protein
MFSLPHILPGLFCWSSGLTLWLLSGILSLPWSPLASLPPDVDVPLPLGLAFIEPLPLGPPLFEPACANASVLDRASMPASVIDESFMIGFLVSSRS